MNSLTQRIFSERIHNENKHFKLQEKFVLAWQKPFLTGKFYAKHDAFSESDIRQEYVDFIVRHQVPPKEIYKYQPPSVNMDYGWFVEPLVPRTTDPRLHFPKKEADFVKYEMNLRKQQKVVPVEKFAGVPFKTK